MLLITATAQSLDDASIMQTLSDIWKDRNGSRPDLSRWTVAEARAWLEDEARRDTFAEDDCSCCCCNGTCNDEDEYGENEDEDYTGLASEYQEGWA